MMNIIATMIATDGGAMLTGTATQTVTASALCILDHSSSLLFQRFSVTLNGAAVSSIIDVNWDCVEAARHGGYRTSCFRLRMPYSGRTATKLNWLRSLPLVECRDLLLECGVQLVMPARARTPSRP